ncbi:MAG: hypothetical protein JJT77_00635 [Crocinitomicaceae bacterium]|nr:hypothetical protein [Crocinitomicaceae bacterium]
MKKLQRILLLNIIIIICLNFLSCGTNRPFPKRLTGNYVGTIESYQVPVQDTFLLVASTQMAVQLQNEDMLMQVGNQLQKVPFLVTAKTKAYYALEVKVQPNVTEHWRLYRKGKKLERLALSPRPSVILIKK